MTVVFCGENAYEREGAARAYVQAFVERFGDVAIERREAGDLTTSELISLVQAVPFLTDRRMVVVRGWTENKEFLESTGLIVSSVPDTTELVVVEPSFDARTKAYKYMQQHTDFRMFHALNEDALPEWIVGRFGEQGVHADVDIATLLIQRVGQNQQLLDNEINKICLYTSRPDRAAIEEIVDAVPHSSIFSMIDSVFAGNIQDALKRYDEQRAQGMDPYAILGMLVWQLHVLATVKAAGTRPAHEIASVSKISPFVIRKNQTLTRRLSLMKIKTMVSDTLTADRMLKRSKATPDDILKTLIISYAV